MSVCTLLFEYCFDGGQGAVTAFGDGFTGHVTISSEGSCTTLPGEGSPLFGTLGVQ